MPIAPLRKNRLLPLCAALAAPLPALASEGAAVKVKVEPSIQRPASEAMVMGFNVTWDCMQAGPDGTSILWDSATKQPVEKLRDFLRVDFSGNVFRYPGGTGANYFVWERSIGPRRGKISPERNWAPRTVHFGLDEFMGFVETLGGVPLLQLNLYTVCPPEREAHNDKDVVDTPEEWAECKRRALAWWEYCNAPHDADWNGDGVFQGDLRRRNGRAEPYRVIHWELDNELDYTGMTARTYADRCKEIADAMLARQPELRLLGHARSAPWAPKAAPVWTEWHKTLLKTTGAKLHGIAWHPYYDGNAVSMMENYAATIWNDGVALADDAYTPPKIYVTEHARWPWSGDPGPRKTWPDASNLYAGIGIADFLIAHAARPYVEMTMCHALAANSPWQYFSKVDETGDQGYLNEFSLRPSAHAMRIVHRVLHRADILATKTTTPSTSRGAEYDVRALGYKYGEAGGSGAIMINRATQGYTTALTLPGITFGDWIVRKTTVGQGMEDGIHVSYLPVETSSGNTLTVRQGARSVTDFFVVGRNRLANGGFEEGSENSAAQWTATQAIKRVRDENAFEGEHVLRLAGAGELRASLYRSEDLSTIPEAIFVLRANVRSSGAKADSVRLVARSAKGGDTASSASSAAVPGDTAGRWVPLALEFVASSVGNPEIVLRNDSPEGHVDFDGVTLLRRKNWFAEAAPRKVAGSKDFTQAVPAGLLGRLNEPWRVSLRVRHDRLEQAGGEIAVRFFDEEGRPVPASPRALALSGTNADWKELRLEFHPREVLGPRKLSRAEFVVTNRSRLAGSSLEIDRVNLEVVE